MLRRAFLAVLGLTLVASLVSPAQAALPVQPDPSWGVNGRVYDMVRVGDLMYLGGNFTSATPPAGGPGTAIPRANLAAINVNTGDLDLTWDPGTNGPVHTLSPSSDGTRIFAGGKFTSVDGEPHANIVAVDALTGEVDHNWSVGTNFAVWASQTLGSSLYIGGAFSNLSIKGKAYSRIRLASVDQTTGAIDHRWRPKATGGGDKVPPTVKTLELSPDGTTMYVGGNFTLIDDQPRLWIAALNTLSGTLNETWIPTQGISFDIEPCGNGCVLDIEATSTHVYAAVGGASGNKLLALDAVTAEFRWQRGGNGDVQAVGVRGSDVFAGGHFERFANRDDRPRFVTMEAITGAITNYAPTVNAGGKLGVWAIETDAQRLYIGGDFTKVSTLDRNRYAQFTDTGPTP